MKQSLLLFIAICFSLVGFAQHKTAPVKTKTTAPAKAPAQAAPSFTKKGSPIPNFYINRTDGGYLIPQHLKKGKPVMIMIFSPECDHCGFFVDSLKTIREQFKTTQVVLVAEERHKDKMQGFIDHLKINNDPLFKLVGTNKGELIAAIYTNKILPQLVFYDAQHKLVKIFDGHYTLGDVAKYVK